MKTPIATMALATALATSAFAQAPSPGTPNFRGRPSAPAGTTRGQMNVPSTPVAAPAPKEDSVFKSGAVLPEPAGPDELNKPTVPLPSGPIPPELILGKEHGPFMVLAHTFRGPEATRYAHALALELRNRFHLPAYIFHARIKPGNSNIRKVQPTADHQIRNGIITEPEASRMYDEAAVLVGNCKSIDESQDLMKQVKKLHPVTLDGLPTIWTWRKQGLKRAMMTTNPYVAAQYLYPGKKHVLPQQPGQPFDTSAALANLGQKRDDSVIMVNGVIVQDNNPSGAAPVVDDPLIKQMNGGPRSLFKCPGTYTLQVAEFLGRTSTDPNDPRFRSEGLLRQSPLAAAGDQAESLAESLEKCKALPRGIRAYVFHDRHSSKVLLGGFQSENDPAYQTLRRALVPLSNELVIKKYTQLPLAPSPTLMKVPKP